MAYSSARFARQVRSFGVLAERDHFVHGPATGPMARLDAQGRLLQVYIYGTRLSVPDAIWHYSYDPVTGEATRSTLSVMTDLRGSVRMVMDVSTGEVVHQLTYDPWGVVLTDSSPGFQPFAFAGGVHDPRTGMLRFGRRDYDPTTGRWTNRDPALFGGGQSNLYTYCAGDPVGLVDPWGTIVESGWDGISIGVGIGSFSANVLAGNVAGAVVDGVGLAVDVGLLLVPGVPGGAGYAIAAYRAGNIAADAGRAAADVAPLVDNAVECARRQGTTGVPAQPTDPRRIYSARELIRRAQDPGPYHNFPESFNEYIFSRGNREFHPGFFRKPKPGMSDDSMLYRLDGILNGVSGV